jgi:hypothetical protein
MSSKDERIFRRMQRKRRNEKKNGGSLESKFGGRSGNFFRNAGTPKKAKRSFKQGGASGGSREEAGRVREARNPRRIAFNGGEFAQMARTRKDVSKNFQRLCGASRVDSIGEGEIFWTAKQRI